MDGQADKKPANKKQFFRYDPVSTVLILAFVFLSSQILSSFLVSLYPAVQDWTESEGRTWLGSTNAQFIYTLLASTISVALIFRIINRARITKQRIGIKRFRITDAGWALVAYGLYFVCLIVLMTVASQLIPGLDFEQEQKIGFNDAQTGKGLLLAFLSLVVIVPIAEEVMFRGFLFSSLRAKYNFLPAIVMTSFLFGIAHLQFGSDAPLLWVAAIDTFVLSVFLCTLREKLGSIWPPVFLHGIKNLVAFLILFGDRLL